MLKYTCKRIVQLAGFDIVRYHPRLPQTQALRDIEPRDMEIIRTAAPYTLTSPERLFALIQSTRYIVEHAIPGDIVECGVWRGGSMLAAALTLLQMHSTDRTLHLFDTFAGMPEPDAEDITASGEAAATILADPSHRVFVNVRAYAALNEVRATMQQTAYDAAKIAYIVGKVEETIPDHAPETIALLRLDTDWYQSTRHELEHLFPRLSPGGVLLIDDYGDWQGCRQAVDEYFAANRVPILLNRIDNTGRIAVKQG